MATPGLGLKGPGSDVRAKGRRGGEEVVMADAAGENYPGERWRWREKAGSRREAETRRAGAGREGRRGQ